MAFALTKKEQTERDALVTHLRTAQQNMDEARDVAEAAMVHLINVFNDSIGYYNAALGDAEMFTDALLSRLEEELDNRSEAWRTSEKGDDAEAFIAEWRELDFLELEMHTEIELHTDDAEHADALDQAPARADSE